MLKTSTFMILGALVLAGCSSPQSKAKEAQEAVIEGFRTALPGWPICYITSATMAGNDLPAARAYRAWEREMCESKPGCHVAVDLTTEIAAAEQVRLLHHRVEPAEPVDLFGDATHLGDAGEIANHHVLGLRQRRARILGTHQD